MNKLQPSIIALSCIMALSACSSSSKGGTDNSEQIRQTEIELNQKIAEANKKAEDAVKKAEEAAKANSQKQTESGKKAEEVTQTEKPQSQQTDTEKSTAQETLKKAEEAAKAAQANNQKTEAEKNAAQEALKKAEEAAKAAQASSQKTEAEKKAAQEALKKAEEAAQAAQAKSQKTEAEKNAAQEALKKAEEAAKAAQANSQKTESEKNAAQEAQKEAEKRLKQLETLQANEKSRIPLSDKIFGGASGEMTETISGGTLVGKQNSPARLLTRDIRDLAIIDENGRIVDINILRRAGEMDPESYEAYDDPYNLRKERQTILSNDNFKSSAFGTYVDNLTGNQYFFAQGLPTAVAQIPTTGIAEYKGGAVYKKDNANSERSEMKASADFADKVIDINIMKKTNAVPEMHFSGKITANSFAGEVNGIKTQGGFFGENAQEMGGLFTNEADQSRGAFGGIKQ
ncbi:MAG: transferrin-binding protein-like solute binding protein [Aggregatibacter sp.]